MFRFCETLGIRYSCEICGRGNFHTSVNSLVQMACQGSVGGSAIIRGGMDFMTDDFAPRSALHGFGLGFGDAGGCG